VLDQNDILKKKVPTFAQNGEIFAIFENSNVDTVTA
jgi:hypothetical protein